VGVSGRAAVEGLFERDVELSRADGLLDGAATGTGAVVLVEGSAGVGKTAVLAAVRAHAEERGFAVFPARASEFESEMAFGVARQLLEPMLRAAGPAQRGRLLDGPAQVGARALGLEAGDAPADRFAAIHGLYWVCANRAERGRVVLAVDDVHWVDDPSLSWLGYLARRTLDLPLILVLGLRWGDPGGARGELQRLLADGGVDRLPLSPLSQAGVAAIVRSRLDEDADDLFCSACSELTGGNPLLVRELLAAANDGGVPARADGVTALRGVAPAAVGVSVLARLASMGPDAVALARAVAVLGAGAEVVVAAELAELDPAVAELTADRLAAAQILASARPLDFFHPLIAAAVTEDLAPGARRLAHRRAAAIVDRDGPLGRVAVHLLACAPAKDSWVVDRLRGAAVEALDRGAPEIAASYGRRALEEHAAGDDRARLLFLLGTAEWRAGQRDAIDHLEQALAAAGEDSATIVAVSSLLAFASVVVGRAERAVEVLERALSAAREIDARSVVTLESSIVLAGHMNETTSQVAMRRAQVSARLQAMADPPLGALGSVAMRAARANDADEAQRLAELAMASESYPPPLEMAVPLIIALTCCECYDAALQLSADLLVVARRKGAMPETVGTLVCQAGALYDCGALADAEADLRWSLERAVGMRRVHAVDMLVCVLIERDALDQAEDVLQQCADPIPTRLLYAARFLYARGRLRAAQGRMQESLDDLLECGARCQRLRLVLLSETPWRGEAALVHLALGNVAEARRLADEHLELAREFGRPHATGMALRVCGLVNGPSGDIELFAEAVRTLEHSQSPLELARALTELGAALRRSGSRVQARVQLERALDLTHQMGARRIAARARSELIAAGAKPRRDAITGRDALTAGELRVARLAADGLTNREIAQALFITTMTAKAHLNHVYRKLGITSRRQLPDALTGRLADLEPRSER
jgi:DNA-binding CsgD family transcriptional regulator/sugar phosphate isomerase/epimerase